jgi:hypothetical protein
MTTNRRGFIASLLALPAAAVAVLHKTPRTTTVQVAKFPVGMPFEQTRLCFNCQRFTAPSKHAAAGADGLSAVTDRWGQFQYHHLCDDCIKSIQHAHYGLHPLPTHSAFPLPSFYEPR